jgi:hypothetical protein
MPRLALFPQVYWYLNRSNRRAAYAAYRVPDNVTCPEGCVLQWYWWAFQSCTLECEAHEDGSWDVERECGQGLVNRGVATCPDNDPSFCERYANCADVIIQGDSSPAAAGDDDAMGEGTTTGEPTVAIAAVQT